MRETKELVIIEKNKELVFEITQMSANDAEMWILTALTLLAKGKSQSQITGDIESFFENPLMILALLDGVDEIRLKRLLDNLYTCVKYKGSKVSSANIDGIVSSPVSILKIKKAVIDDLKSFLEELHQMYSGVTESEVETQATTINMRTSEQA